MVSRGELVVGWMFGMLSILATVWHARIPLQPTQHRKYLPYVLKQKHDGLTSAFRIYRIYLRWRRLPMGISCRSHA
jgi:hypothetical protein